MTSPSGDAPRPGSSTAAGTGVADELDLTPEQLAAQWEEEKPPAAGPLANLGAAVVVALLAIGGIVGAVQLGIGSPEKPQPGMWPLIISVVMLVLAGALAAFGRGATDTEKFSGSSWLVMAGLATLVGLVALLPVIGFEIPSLLLTFVWLKFLGKETWRTSVLLSFIIVAAFYLIFVTALGVPLPHLF